jgi:Arc/MetJ-type ribon-helix-helix transcriptional regulator
LPTNERVTVRLPPDLVRDIDRVEKNRSKFIQEAARHELERRRREQLARSLRSPHADADELAEAGFEEWASSLPDEHAIGLVDLRAGREVRWVPGEGWSEGSA